MAHKVAPTAQEAIATARFIRMSPTKARQVVALIRGRHVDDARRVLKFTPRAASVPVGKVLESAIANAEHNR
ncbi:MAG TPA: uL22 family ribosomal protein, partial [Actinomycetota bacterium]|nr:uL22 family ribosomal protein [Actinomycetota bacterium]